MCGVRPCVVLSPGLMMGTLEAESDPISWKRSRAGVPVGDSSPRQGSLSGLGFGAVSRRSELWLEVQAGNPSQELRSRFLGAGNS